MERNKISLSTSSTGSAETEKLSSHPEKTLRSRCREREKVQSGQKGHRGTAQPNARATIQEQGMANGTRAENRIKSFKGGGLGWFWKNGTSAGLKCQRRGGKKNSPSLRTATDS